MSYRLQTLKNDCLIRFNYLKAKLIQSLKTLVPFENCAHLDLNGLYHEIKLNSFQQCKYYIYKTMEKLAGRN